MGIGVRGRPLTAMLTVASGVPLQFIMWYGIAPGSALNNVWVFFVIQALFQLLANWAQPGCNFPVLGQIVTGKDRNKVMCWEMAFENTMATIIGSNAVPLVIQAFGSDKITYNGQQDLEQARTLGLAQTVIICIPWMICFGVYSLLLWSFPIDVKRVEKEQQEMAIVGKGMRSVKFERYSVLLSQLRLSLYHLILLYRSCTNTMLFSASLGGVVLF